ncbi:MAG TPA: bifunctional hydroxymethylpyrimidine kinase/phosphomethylpyrimidine kinase [Desulfuromonadales bacterium]|nr:bifunctional hydroxymethylpyrimidine kinase/phosphomethylpyrimidine kinase [Desulfuromonadales bacterium]
MTINGLYLITDSDSDGRLAERVAAALRGGARVVQYRDKYRPAEQQVVVARELGRLCRQAGAVFLVNDSPQLALLSEADGVHLGQGDGSIGEARSILGPGRIIGVSTRTVDQALAAQSQGADYIGLGAIYPTGSKNNAELVGLERLRQVRQAVTLPIVAIGGIDRDNAGAAIDAGAEAVAVISAVMGADAPAVAAREISLLFNRRLPFPRGRILTVAGSDSSGGAGIQADLKTITLLGGYGMSALTALTAQNTSGVRGVYPVPVDFVEAQIEAVLGDLGADVIKTGMLYSAGIVAAAARAIERYALPAVVDPVMLAKGGSPLLRDEAVSALREELLPRTYLLTPNLPEAETLTGLPVRTEKAMELAARRLQEMGASNILLKGGHLPGEAVDLLLAGRTLHRFCSPRIATRNTHGTGCTYAAAIATFIAQGLPLIEAVGRAKVFLTTAIETAVPLGAGHGPVNHWQAAKVVASCSQTGPTSRTGQTD